MSRKKRDLTEDERALWTRVAATAKPLKRASKTHSPRGSDPGFNPGESRAAQRFEKRGIALAPPAARAVKTSAQPPADRGGEKRVRRGKLAIDSSLDLHGHTQETGRTALLRFVRAAQARGDRTLVVVTGVGRGGHGVLKQRLPDWLNELRPLIAGYAQAHRQHGGAGAFYVFLKRG